jgi:hypothetical protein
MTDITSFEHHHISGRCIIITTDTRKQEIERLRALFKVSQLVSGGEKFENISFEVNHFPHYIEM